MFACPHCQFENPIDNRFCQRCGKALRGLRAVIIPMKAEQTLSSPQLETANTLDSGYSMATTASAEAVADVGTTMMTVAELLVGGNYLKGEERYQLRQPEAAHQAIEAGVMLDILDCDLAAEPPITQLFDATLNASSQDDFQDLLPPAALPYWQLQEQFFPMVPELQATWQIHAVTVIILEDRSDWQYLSDLEKSGEIEPLELVHWFYEMVNLWEALKRFKAEDSLLEQDNLRVDNDQILCIERLIHNKDDAPRTLKDLGLFWQSILQQFPSHAIPPLINLITDIGSGLIKHVTAIEEILANIAENLQQDSALNEFPESESIYSTDENPMVSLAVAATDSNSETGVLALNDLSDEALEALEETEDAEVDGVEDSFADLPTMALPMKLNRLDEYGRTHVGRQRKQNEDFFFTETQLQRVNTPSGTQLKARGLYILCDGMGGHSGGEVASALAVKTLRQYFSEQWQADLPDEAMVTEAILKTNRVIFDRNEAEGRTGNARMGTTLVMVLIADNQAVVAHVGDSRLYCLTRQGFYQVTVDHEVGQREINRGVEPAIAYARADAYQLTQALGPRSNEEVVPTVDTIPISQDTLLLLCSDGLSDNELLEKHLESHVKPLLRSRQDLEEGVADLIDLANTHNGHDNITAIAVRIKMRPNLETVPGSNETTLSASPLSRQTSD